MANKLINNTFIYFSIFSLLSLLSRPFSICLRGFHISTLNLIIFNIFFSLFLLICFRNYVLLFLLTLGGYFYFYFGIFLYKLFAIELFLTNYLICTFIHLLLFYNMIYIQKYYYFFLIFFSISLIFFSINGLVQRYVFNYCLPKDINELTITKGWSKFYHFGLRYVGLKLKLYYYLLVINDYKMFKRLFLQLFKKKRLLVINEKSFDLPIVIKKRLKEKTLSTASGCRVAYVINFTLQIIYILQDNYI